MGRQPRNFTTTLPPDLQIRVLALLSTKDRAGLPLVCKDFERLANDPRNSLLWDTLDLTVPLELERTEEALRHETRNLLRARGRQTRDLSLRFSPRTEPQWSHVFGATLLPLFPQLRQLTLGRPGYYRFQPVDRRCLFRNCQKLEGLVISTKGRYFTEAIECICQLTDLTRLALDFRRVGVPEAELQAALEPLQALAKLRSLSLRLETFSCNRCDLPACVPAQLLRLESLHFEHSPAYVDDELAFVGLPATVSMLQCLTALALHSTARWADIWPAVSGMESLKQLDISSEDYSMPPSLQPAAFRTGLTGLTCCTTLSSLGPPPRMPAAANKLVLPALQALKLGHAPFGARLDWGSLTSLRALTCCVQGEQPGFGYRAGLGLSLLTRLELKGSGIKDAQVLGCSLTSLCSLTLKETSLSTLPEVGARLTALTLLGNEGLVFDAALYDTLVTLPALCTLHLCVCDAGPEDPMSPHVLSVVSLAFLFALRKGLAACKACRCHDQGLELTRY